MAASLLDEVFELLALATQLEEQSRVEAATKVCTIGRTVVPRMLSVVAFLPSSAMQNAKHDSRSVV